jgi:hypothetical protein
VAPSLAISALETAAAATGSALRFTCSLPASWARSYGKMEEFNSTPYISPYLSCGRCWAQTLSNWFCDIFIGAATGAAPLCFFLL